MPELVVDAVYCIELCSGEQRTWKYLGQDSRQVGWWMDLETRREFSESGLIYAWTVKARISVET